MTVVSSTLLFTTASLVTRLLLAGFLVLYLANKVRQFLLQTRSVNQLRLEKQFIQQRLRVSVLRHSFQEAHHLWHRSALWAGLKGILSMASISPSTLESFYAARLAPFFRFSRGIDLLFLLLILVIWTSEILTTRFPVLLLLGCIPLLIIFATDIQALLLSTAICDKQTLLVKHLTTWTESYLEWMDTSSTQPYQHTVLYRAFHPTGHI